VSRDSATGDGADIVVALKLIGDSIIDPVIRSSKTLNDESGILVGCLTSAITGVTSGLCLIADAIKAHTEFLRERAEGDL